MIARCFYLMSAKLIVYPGIKNKITIFIKIINQININKLIGASSVLQGINTFGALKSFIYLCSNMRKYRMLAMNKMEVKHKSITCYELR